LCRNACFPSAQILCDVGLIPEGEGGACGV
jgi:hypothetical protein